MSKKSLKVGPNSQKLQNQQQQKSKIGHFRGLKLQKIEKKTNKQTKNKQTNKQKQNKTKTNKNKPVKSALFQSRKSLNMGTGFRLSATHPVKN